MRIGVTPSVIENIVGKRGGKPSYDVLEKILSAFAYINAEWLILGTGNMFKQNEEEQKLIGQSNHSEAEKILREIINEKDKRIEQLSKEIGRLERKLEEVDSGHFDGRDADIATCADAG